MIKTLPWDTNFFGFKVGMINLLTEPDWDKLNKELRSVVDQYKLIYFITAENLKIPEIILNNYNGNFINQRILYQKKLEKLDYNFPDYIAEYKSKILTPEFASLALVSGTYSRFKIDVNIPPGKFEELYHLWIKNSLSGEIADGIIISNHKEKVTAMVTYKNTRSTCNIGLIAVDTSQQGKGTGKHLIKKTEDQAVKMGLSQIRVTTQSNNVQACLFYEKLRFTPIEISNYYHFWIK